jgi:exopolysaccharide biosynthesis protein
MRARSLQLLTLAPFISLAACGPADAPRATIAMNWQLVDSLAVHLPQGVRVYAGRNDSLPLVAWYVRIDEAHPAIRTRVVVSDDTTDNRETVTSFATDLGACVAVNGGYFAMSDAPARHVGLLLSDGTLWEPATAWWTWDSLRYETARAAIGFTAGDAVEITWATTHNDTLYTWPDPLNHRLGEPADPLVYGDAEPWKVRDALGAGPALVADGEIRVTLDQEAFFGSYLQQPHPRTAAGRTADGDLILMVVDGRQPESRGATLDELADLMLGAGAVQALNLDGGGSSTLVVNGGLVNRPAGGIEERQVMSALVTFCE